MGQGTKVPPFHWVLFTLILSHGTFGSEGKKFQQKASKSHEDDRDTSKWMEFELFKQKGNDLPIRFGDQALTKMPRDIIHKIKKKSQENGTLKRRHVIPQVILIAILLSSPHVMCDTIQARKASSRQDQGGGIRTIAGQSPSDFAFSMARYIGSKFSPQICCFWSIHFLSRWPSLAQLVSWKRDEASKCDGPDELCSLKVRCKSKYRFSISIRYEDWQSFENEMIILIFRKTQKIWKRFFQS